jgi:hypothetical protein
MLLKARKSDAIIRTVSRIIFDLAPPQASVRMVAVSI